MKEVTLRMNEIEALQKLYYGCAGPTIRDALHTILTRAEAVKEESRVDEAVSPRRSESAPYYGNSYFIDNDPSKLDRAPSSSVSDFGLLAGLSVATALDSVSADPPASVDPSPMTDDFSGGGGDLGGAGASGDF